MSDLSGTDSSMPAPPVENQPTRAPAARSYAEAVAAAVRANQLNTTAAYVALELTTLADRRTGEFGRSHSQVDLVDFIGVPLSSLRRSLVLLDRAGLLERVTTYRGVSRENPKNTYRLTIPARADGAA